MRVWVLTRFFGSYVFKLVFINLNLQVYEKNDLFRVDLLFGVMFSLGIMILIWGACIL